jgi:hypothetical protein
VALNAGWSKSKFDLNVPDVPDVLSNQEDLQENLSDWIEE